MTYGTHLVSPTKPNQLVEFAVQHNLPAIGLADYGGLSESFNFYKSAIEHNIKPILGMRVPICEKDSSIKVDNPAKREIYVLARNLAGWHDLLGLCHYINRPEHLNGVPRLSLLEFKKQSNNDNWIIIVPSEYSEQEFAKIPATHKWYGLRSHQDVNFGMPACYTGYNEFLTPSDRQLAEILRAAHFKCKIRDLVEYMHDRHVLTDKEVGVRPEVLEATHQILELIEDFSPLNSQALPSIGENQHETLETLCYNSLKNFGLHAFEIYYKRLQYELEVFKEAKIAGYFLVMQDIVKFARTKSYVGTCRGSAGGCLVSYLLGITTVDPVKYNLVFERFYNPGRKDYPDIDIDIDPKYRDEIIQYLQTKYGRTKFAQIATFGTLKGAAALKRACSTSNKEITASEQNAMTKHLPLEGKITPQLKQQLKELGTESTLLWALLNEPDKLSQWCVYKNGEYDGEYSTEFEAAVKLDGVIQNRGRHASAFVLSDVDLTKRVPLVWDTISKRYIVGTDMHSAESAGLVKIDLLGLDLLSKAKYIRETMRNGYAF